MIEKITISEQEAGKIHQNLGKIVIPTEQEIIESLENDPNTLKKALFNYSDWKEWYLHILDTLNNDAKSILIMLPGITPNFPESDGSAYTQENNWKKELVGLQSYWWKSPFTYTLAELVWEKDSKWQSRIIQVNYPMNDNEWWFNIQLFTQKIQSYLNNIKNFKEKWISVYGASMWWKIAIYTAWEILKNGWKLENLILYAPAISTDLLVPPTNLLDKVPLDLATAFQKLIALPFIDWQIKNSYKKDWWIELSKEDLQKLWKAVWWYDVSWQQMKARLKFIASSINNETFKKYIDLINKSWTTIVVLTSDIWNGTDGALVNSKIEEKIKQLFPNLYIKLVNIEWLPHVNVPQAANLHKKILEENL